MGFKEVKIIKVCFRDALFLPHRFFFKCLGKIVIRDCDMSWYLPNFVYYHWQSLIRITKTPPLDPTFI